MYKSLLLRFVLCLVFVSCITTNYTSLTSNNDNYSNNNVDKTINSVLFGILIFIPIVATLMCMFIITIWVLCDHYSRYYENTRNNFL